MMPQKKSLHLSRMRRVRSLLRQGTTVRDIMSMTGAQSFEIAAQRSLLIAAGYSIQSAKDLERSNGRSGAFSRGRDGGAGVFDVDLVTAFSSPPSRSALFRMGICDE